MCETIRTCFQILGLYIQSTPCRSTLAFNVPTLLIATLHSRGLHGAITAVVKLKQRRYYEKKLQYDPEELEDDSKVGVTWC